MGRSLKKVESTILKVSDNSGAKTVKCIKVLGGFKRKVACVGDTIVVSVKELRDALSPNSKVKKGQVCRAIIIRTKKVIKNENGTFTFFDDNAVVLLNKKDSLLATRVIGPVSKKLKNISMKFGVMSNGFV